MDGWMDGRMGGYTVTLTGTLGSITGFGDL